MLFRSPLCFHGLSGYGTTIPVQIANSSHITVAFTAKLCHLLGFLDLLQRPSNNGLIVKEFNGHSIFSVICSIVECWNGNLMLGASALGRPRGMVWGRRREEGSGWGTHVYLWRIHFDIWQVRCTILDAWGWCIGTTQRNGMGKEEGGGFRMGCNSLQSYELQHARPPCPLPTPGVHSDSRPSINSAAMNIGGTRVSFPSGFLSVYAQQWDCWIIRQFYFQFFKESPHCSP